MNIRAAAKVIATAALIVGGLDFLLPTLSAYLSGGSITRLWQFVASGIFGSRAFAMGVAGVICGICFHFMIMGIFSSLVFVLYKRFPAIRRRAVLSGLVYGAGMWVVMNFLVVPLSNTGAEFPKMNLGVILSWGFLLGILSHMIFGLLLVLITKKCLKSRQNETSAGQPSLSH